MRGPLQKVKEKESHLARKQLKDEETLANVPEKFLNPIMSTFMLDPVNLPNAAARNMFTFPTF